MPVQLAARGLDLAMKDISANADTGSYDNSVGATGKSDSRPPLRFMEKVPAIPPCLQVEVPPDESSTHTPREVSRRRLQAAPESRLSTWCVGMGLTERVDGCESPEHIERYQ